MAQLLEEFPPVATADWEAVVAADLKGAKRDKLVWHTAEGIAVQPFYRRQDLEGRPQADPGITPGWEIADSMPANVDVDAARFEEAGANAVQELGFALAEGIEHYAQNRPAAMTFSFAIGSSYFLQIAKLRAFRLLWARVAESFGAAIPLTLHTRTSRWNKSIYDAYNNVLRTTTEAMSAAIGGADTIHVEPFDFTFRQPTAASERLAHNVHLVLKHEAYLDRVGDPAAGSYYVETLTDSLAREAWKLMQRIEEMGGFTKAHDMGMIPGEIAASRAKKELDVAQRRRIFVGVNQYPDAGERMLDKLSPHDSLELRRGPEAFEDLRLRTEQSNHPPVFLLAEFGDLKMRKARSQFCANFFGCAGFKIVTQHFGSADEIAAAQADAIVLCSSDGEYSSVAADVVAAIAKAGRKTPVIVAGYPKESVEALEAAGVAGFVHARSNAVEALAHWQEALQVGR